MPKTAPNPIDRHVGARVRVRRMMLGRSQEWLGGQLGLTFQQVQKYEKGTNRIGSSRIQAIAQALDVPVAFFFDGLPRAGAGAEPTMLASELLTGFFSLPGAGDLAQAFTSLEPPRRRMLVDLAQALAGDRPAKLKQAA
jgi:transcriptional regulator with XRE-family HTH domain